VWVKKVEEKERITVFFLWGVGVHSVRKEKKKTAFGNQGNTTLKDLSAGWNLGKILGKNGWDVEQGLKQH